MLRKWYYKCHLTREQINAIENYHCSWNTYINDFFALSEQVERSCGSIIEANEQKRFHFSFLKQASHWIRLTNEFKEYNSLLKKTATILDR